MQRVHTEILRTVPSANWWRTFCKLGWKTRLVLILEWLTKLPVWGILPQHSHFLLHLRAPLFSIALLITIFSSKLRASPGPSNYLRFGYIYPPRLEVNTCPALVFSMPYSFLSAKTNQVILVKNQLFCVHALIQKGKLFFNFRHLKQIIRE